MNGETEVTDLVNGETEVTDLVNGETEANLSNSAMESTILTDQETEEIL